MNEINFRNCGAVVASRLLSMDDFSCLPCYIQLDKVCGIVADMVAALLNRELTDAEDNEVRIGALGVIYEDEDEYEDEV